MAGLRYLLGDPFLRTVIIACTITNFFFQTIALLLVILAERKGLPSPLIGLLLSASGIGGLLGALTAPRVLRRFRPQVIVILSVWSWLPLTILIAITHEPIIGLLAWGCLSLTGAHTNVALAIRQARVPVELQGRISSISSFLTSGAVPVGASCAGYIVDGLGTHHAAALVGLVVTILAVVIPFSEGGQAVIIEIGDGLKGMLRDWRRTAAHWPTRMWVYVQLAQALLEIPDQPARTHGQYRSPLQSVAMVTDSPKNAPYDALDRQDGLIISLAADGPEALIRDLVAKRVRPTTYCRCTDEYRRNAAPKDP